MRLSLQISQKVVVAGVAALILGFFFLQMHKSTSWPAKEYSHPEILNLTQTKHPWKVWVGETVKTKVVLPGRDFPMKDYSPGKTIVYQTSVTLPEHMRETSESIVFHSYYVWAKRYEFYINDELVETGASESMNIVIPQKFLQSTHPLAFKIRVHAEGLPYQGISHYGDVAIGKKTIFAPLKDRVRDAKTSNYLWSVLPKLALTLIFCFLFLTLAKIKENFAFIVFAAASCLKPLLASAYGQEMIPVELRSLELNTLVDAYAQVFFLAFVCMYFRCFEKLTQVAFIGVTFALTFLCFAAYSFLSAGQQTVILNKTALGLRFTVLALAVLIAAKTARALHVSGKSMYRRNIAAGFSMLFALSLILLTAKKIGWLAGVPWAGTIENFYELVLFCVLTAVLAFDFSRIEKQKSIFEHKVQTQAKELASAKLDQAIAHTTRMIAHDVRKPFLTLKNILRELLTDERNEKMSEYLQHTERSLQNVDGMLQDIMEVGGAGTAENLQPAAINELMDAAVAEITHMHPDHKVQFSVHHEANHYAMVHSHKIGRVFLNILENALQAMKFQGDIWVKSRSLQINAQEFIEVTIGNNGPLIAPEDVEKVFDGFFTKGKTNGTGIGLMVVKRMVEAHGGTIRCTSNPQQGTEFIFTLRKFRAAKPMSEESGYIIIVDDDIYLNRFWEKKLGEMHVKVFSSPTELLYFLSSSPRFLNSVDCIVTDYYFDNDTMNGVDLAAFIRNINKDVCMFLSTSSHPSGVGIQVELFDAVLEKRVYAWNELQTLKVAHAGRYSL